MRQYIINNAGDQIRLCVSSRIDQVLQVGVQCTGTAFCDLKRMSL